MASKARSRESGEAMKPGAEAEASAHHLVDSMREEKIRCRAYEIYLDRGGEPGHDLEDWLQAEQEHTAGESKPAGE